MKQSERDDLLITIKEHTKNTDEKINEMRNTLFGNGKEGLCYTIERHKTYFKLFGLGFPLSISIICIIFKLL